MNELVLLSIAIFANLFGMMCLSLSLPTHWKQVFSESDLNQKKQVVFRVFAVFLFAVSLILSLMTNHSTIAPLVWVMSLTISAYLVAMILAKKEKLV